MEYMPIYNKAKADLQIRKLLKDMNPKRKLNADKILISQKRLISTCNSMKFLNDLRDTAKKWYMNSKLLEAQIMTFKDYESNPGHMRDLEKARKDIKMLEERHGFDGRIEIIKVEKK